MRFPRVSIGTLMASVSLIAINCAIYRSLETRPDYLMGMIRFTVLAVLPMWNLLAIGLAIAIWRRFQVGPFLIGFEAFGLLAVIATLFGFEPMLMRSESILAATRFATWVEAVPLRLAVFQCLIIYALPLVLQLVVAATGGAFLRLLWKRFRGAWVAIPASKPLRGASLLGLLILVAASGIVVEGILRWKVDPRIPTRLAAGTEATFDQNPLPGVWAKIPIISTTKMPEGTLLKVEVDDSPSLPQIFMTTGGRFERDLRMVQIRWLDGDDSGKTALIPYCQIKPVSKTRTVQ